MKDESTVSDEVRLKASQLGWRLWRNNVGVAVDKRGIPVRYGLCNESKRMNTKTKSSDLIGIRPVVITQDMVGKVIGQFVAVEVKRSNWKWSGSPRELAQLNYHGIVNELGGYGVFMNNMEDLK